MPKLTSKIYAIPNFHFRQLSFLVLIYLYRNNSFDTSHIRISKKSKLFSNKVIYFFIVLIKIAEKIQHFDHTYSFIIIDEQRMTFNFGLLLTYRIAFQKRYLPKEAIFGSLHRVFNIFLFLFSRNRTVGRGDTCSLRTTANYYPLVLLLLITKTDIVDVVLSLLLLLHRIVKLLNYRPSFLFRQKNTI